MNRSQITNPQQLLQPPIQLAQQSIRQLAQWLKLLLPQYLGPKLPALGIPVPLAYGP